MKLSEFIKKTINNALIIFASIIIIITVMRQFYYPELVFDVKSIYIIMTFSLLGALTGFILYSANDISEKKMRVRIAIHFVALEVILISLSIISGIVNSASTILILAVQIAVVYTIVRLLSWQNDKREAQRINEKLKQLKRDSI